MVPHCPSTSRKEEAACVDRACVADLKTDKKLEVEEQNFKPRLWLGSSPVGHHVSVEHLLTPSSVLRPFDAHIGFLHWARYYLHFTDLETEVKGGRNLLQSPTAKSSSAKCYVAALLGWTCTITTAVITH